MISQRVTTGFQIEQMISQIGTTRFPKVDHWFPKLDHWFPQIGNTGFPNWTNDFPNGILVSQEWTTGFPNWIEFPNCSLVSTRCEITLFPQIGCFKLTTV
ncbi:hypothetical protein AVEN_80192-1 [Araneus ventricosus]|uniref:Uncharacterized protein n=1 Tax=Araneus ventricosus TaxID=182803 RepID=A0A4Y2FFM0_ARAVE|nr:hypothetical protein AVEN_80192-1 [Araneus ventricosus]